ncbi:hypothetical protein K505DRAFT_352610 [Melanomma pulvis-pyrius CBS 109.77]|uniref:Protein kinase domain-containing protein n=1 Tax=Melanomma pulvis-pyrius CBS 109.77 TaxID=1314802 RepID=A0A6A6WZU4_9PLEO|nr:hypothetical protein K505DRAFT_352610 [Melanomma pulvis-pyrius CBS 109.77]
MFAQQPRVDSFLEPNIRAKRDLRDLCEVEDYETGAFKRTTFTYVNNQDVARFGGRNFFIKRPKLLCLNNKEETQLLPQMLLKEAKVLEFLKQHYYPNLIRCHGCTINRGCITGISLQKHQITLQYRLKKGSTSFDIVGCMQDIRAGVKHLHSLGFAHNDLNPMNIALDSNDDPINLDFGSCRRLGEQLLSAGTYGWIEDDFTTSAQRHDEFAMDRIEVWLK